jgi:hypothetical protein
MSDKIPFRSLPLFVQFASFLCLLLGWVLIEELVIDRYGLSRFLPLYRVGAFCVYDAIVISGLIVAWAFTARPR